MFAVLYLHDVNEHLIVAAVFIAVILACVPALAGWLADRR